jgi:hypothetical protein
MEMGMGILLEMSMSMAPILLSFASLMRKFLADTLIPFAVPLVLVSDMRSGMDCVGYKRLLDCLPATIGKDYLT